LPYLYEESPPTRHLNRNSDSSIHDLINRLLQLKHAEGIAVVGLNNSQKMVVIIQL